MKKVKEQVQSINKKEEYDTNIMWFDNLPTSMKGGRENFLLL